MARSLAMEFNNGSGYSKRLGSPYFYLYRCKNGLCRVKRKRLFDNPWKEVSDIDLRLDSEISLGKGLCRGLFAEFRVRGGASHVRLVRIAFSASPL